MAQRWCLLEFCWAEWKEEALQGWGSCRWKCISPLFTRGFPFPVGCLHRELAPVQAPGAGLCYDQLCKMCVTAWIVSLLPCLEMKMHSHSLELGRKVSRRTQAGWVWLWVSSLDCPHTAALTPALNQLPGRELNTNNPKINPVSIIEDGSFFVTFSVANSSGHRAPTGFCLSAHRIRPDDLQVGWKWFIEGLPAWFPHADTFNPWHQPTE